MLGRPNCLGIVVVLIKECYFRILQGEFKECLCTIPQSKFTCRISNQILTIIYFVKASYWAVFLYIFRSNIPISRVKLKRQ